MNPRYIAIFAVIIILIGGGLFLFNNDTPSEPAPEEGGEETVCTLDAKLCPDGSSVGRVPPSCEFAACPGETDETIDTSNATSTEASTAAMVRYTDDGFEPKTVTIKKGETVRFVNESERNMWVGSALHPTHEVYPQKSETDCLGSSFDQCKAEGKGSVYEFTFDFVGSWNYHNHMRANHFGTVVVTE